jgi:hypothetical protein
MLEIIYTLKHGHHRGVPPEKLSPLIQYFHLRKQDPTSWIPSSRKTKKKASNSKPKA